MKPGLDSSGIGGCMPRTAGDGKIMPEQAVSGMGTQSATIHPDGQLAATLISLRAAARFAARPLAENIEH
jgi:hypothetical protein